MYSGQLLSGLSLIVGFFKNFGTVIVFSLVCPPSIAEGGQNSQPRGGGVMTLHDYGYQPPEFLKSHPVSE